MAGSDEIILGAGVLCLCAFFAGMASVRVGTPLLLVFIAVGMLAGEDGPGGIPFNDLHTAYLAGSLGLATILFQGGLSTDRAMLRQALWPALALATAGVAIGAGLVGVVGVLAFGLPWRTALLAGAVMAPTDAAAVSVLLRLSRAPLPARVHALLEVESGLNDPMGVFLTLCLTGMAAHSGGIATWAGAFGLEMGGGIVIGLLGGSALLWLFRRLPMESGVAPVLAVGGGLAVFGGAQVLGASGFLAVYLAGIVVGTSPHPADETIRRFFGALGWLAQIGLFLMLGLLVTPHALPAYLMPGLVLSAAMIAVGRPVAVFACLAPFRWSLRESAFVSWVGLRGAVPIFLTTIPLLQGVPDGRPLFDIVFVAVIASVAIQGWTLGPLARRLFAGRGEAHG